MPQPVPMPFALEIATVADMTMLTTDEVTSMVAADSDQDISDAKWELTLADIDTWNASFAAGKRQTKKVGPIEFFEDSEYSELDFRNRIRSRYGQELLTSVRGTAESGLVASSLAWF